MITKLRVGVVGVGFIGNLHARIFSESPISELVAVADLDEELAKKVAKNYNCDFYCDAMELYARPDIQAVSSSAEPSWRHLSVRIFRIR